MIYLLHYNTDQEFIDAQGVSPGQDVQRPIPGVAYTDTARITDYNPIPKEEPALIFINNTNEAGTVTLTARELYEDTDGTQASSFPDISLDWSNNGKSFQTKSNTNTTTGDTITFDLPANGKLWLKGNNTRFANGTYRAGCGKKGGSSSAYEYPKSTNIKFWSFSCNKSHSINGQVMALCGNETALTTYQFAGLFNNDSTLVNISNNVLPNVISVPEGAYARMFEGATNLTNMPNIPGETMGVASCFKMFSHSGIHEAKELPATTISEAAYRAMFNNATSLTAMTYALPAESTNISSYAYMFNGCRNLTVAPEVMAVSAYPFCCAFMFTDCEKLKSPAAMYLKDFWGVNDPYYAVEACEYMYENCYELESMPSFLGYPDNTFNNNGNVFQYMFWNCRSLVNVVNLTYPSVQHWTYAGMFSGCTSLTTPPIISASTAGDYAFYGMFAGCSSLTIVAPTPRFSGIRNGNIYTMRSMYEGCVTLTSATIPSVSKIEIGCFYEMFKGCTNLTASPDLNHETLADGCYRGMFSGCTNLSTIKCLASDMTASNCTKDWVAGVAANGTFTKKAGVTWTSGVDGIPVNWIETT